LEFICPRCKAQLIIQDGWVLCENNHKFPIKDGIYDFLPENINLITKADALYHGSIKKEWIELNQIETIRNIYYHLEIIDFIKSKSSRDTNILELGGGVGYDLGLFIERKPLFKNYFYSDINHEMTSYAKNIINNVRITYANIDATYLPFRKASLDIVFMIAALHHFPDFDPTLYEIVQAIKPNGYLICGIEPNRKILLLSNLIKYPIKKLISNKKESSPADEKAKGFTPDDFLAMANRYHLKIEKIEPVFFLCGFFHNGLELIYRLLRLTRRIRLPMVLEKILIHVDRKLFRYNFFRQLSWHYSVIFQKKPHVKIIDY
jgi:SAM-dependent methyltransferase